MENSPQNIRRLQLTGKIAFQINGIDQQYDDVKISMSGISGLPWGAINPESDLGRQIPVSITLPNNAGLRLLASIRSEMTPGSSHMGLKFHLDQIQEEILEKLLVEFGAFPRGNFRIQPRLKMLSKIPNCPLFAIANLTIKVRADKAQFSRPVVFEISSLSPAGGEFQCEDSAIEHLAPNDVLKMEIIPRGKQKESTIVTAVVCRIQDEINPYNGNTIRSIGVRFDAVEKPTVFSEMLSGVLEP